MPSGAPNRLPPVPRLEVLGVGVHPVTVEILHDYIAGSIAAGGKALIPCINVQGMNLAAELPWFRRFLRSADLVFCDGWGVKLGAAVLGVRIPARITYADWIWRLAAFAEKEGFSLYLLGGWPGAAAEAAGALAKRFPRLRIAGHRHGFFDQRPGSEENRRVIEEINAVRPQILIVGFGMPVQERWLWENWKDVRANVALTGGAVFEYTSGRLRRAPRWMTDHGLEWLGRLLIEPRRLWKRYLVGNAVFLWRVIKARLA